MSGKFNSDVVLGIIVLAMAGIAPNIYPAAMKGIAGMPFLYEWLLLPSIIIIIAIYIVSRVQDRTLLSHRMLVGAVAGVIATVGLEIVRIFGFKMGWMPGDMPKLLGVLITNRFMEGPSTWSNILGYTYHYWNGAAFGMIFVILLGRKPVWWGLIYALLIGTGFLLSPSVKAMGVGFMGTGLPGMIEIVYGAHIAFGLILGYLAHRWLKKPEWLLQMADITSSEDPSDLADPQLNELEQEH
ncbi:MAG TPA: hypothetical protein VKA08_02770 [Balneolales bacterium]|nr:hypothetical protein [Balneolales bacterium]